MLVLLLGEFVDKIIFFLIEDEEFGFIMLGFWGLFCEDYYG